MDREGERNQERDAQASLDQIRHQAGDALSGREIASRRGEDAEIGPDDPPLDWRLTPRNVILQIAGVAFFAVVVWFLATLAIDGVATIFGGASGGGA